MVFDMKDLICIKCGEEAWKNNLCRRHFIENRKLMDAKGFSVTICRNCGSHYDGKWIDSSLEKSLVDMARKRILSKIKTKIVSVRKINRIQLKITATARIGGIKKMEEKIVNILLKKRLCDNCVRLSGGYYEAVLQIRGKNSETLLEKTENSIDKPAVAGVQKVSNGYDIRLLKKDSARKFVRLLRGYEIKKSYKHVTTKKGKAIYRDYYSIK